MCWSESASVAMVAIGGGATIYTALRGEPKAIWLTIGYFTAMEGLQAVGYGVVDQCGEPGNRIVTQLSYLHIAFQPFFINAFAMAIAPVAVSPQMRRLVYGLCAVASGFLLLRLVPLDAVGPCQAGDILCAAQWCLVSGEWHIGWQVPLNDLWRGIGIPVQFPAYMAAAFLLPLVYGAWRFALFHATAGPFLASILTGNPYEMPAIWCLFSIGLLLIGVSPAIRTHVFNARGAVAA
ncbi:DUF5765 domain-containing protein [Marivita hallyeonensis]|uniref:Uncharacterized protein n=1 Tax=Marivita hallyeonensis TaxID=996342 RepID=A0A1M5VGW7_9RHOB|nr:DUF5765 domain-containing protein [Marivita hallyeonensis]SHH74418.1 hypothetical protein SAMN05443551_2865 [Marivita hallyeonensis]